MAETKQLADLLYDGLPAGTPGSVSGTEGFTLPSGTTAERPSSPTNGEIRYNTSTRALEVYASGAWTAVTEEYGTGSGGTETNSGGYTIHTFTSSSTFTVSDAA